MLKTFSQAALFDPEPAPAPPPRRTSGKAPATPAAPAPPPPLTDAPYREQLASWPDEHRLAWGRRANELEAKGLPWRSAEEQAFNEVSQNPERFR